VIILRVSGVTSASWTRNYVIPFFVLILPPNNVATLIQIAKPKERHDTGYSLIKISKE
jgi:hypothetical protein